MPVPRTIKGKLGRIVRLLQNGSSQSTFENFPATTEQENFIPAILMVPNADEKI
jgi:hypothetical protein